VKMLDMLAANKTAVMSYHFAWPGFGHVVKNGDGFRYIAEPMNIQLWIGALPGAACRSAPGPTQGFLFVPKAFPGSICRAGFQPPCAKLPSQTTANLSPRRHERRAGRSASTCRFSAP
jgi:hypothetical protein